MEQLKHADELRSFADVPLDHTDVADAELDLAIRIIEQRVSESFEPEKYEDEVRRRFEEAIAQKVEGKEVAVPAEAEPEAKIIDLMEALKASVGDRAKAAARKPAQRVQKKRAVTKRSVKRKSG
jgi:DNA end-binding protein Ku